MDDKDLRLMATRDRDCELIDNVHNDLDLVFSLLDFEDYLELEMVGRVSNPAEAFQVIENRRPDLAVIDIEKKTRFRAEFFNGLR